MTLSKGRWMSFFGLGNKAKETQEYQDHTEQSSVKESIVIECSSCGAKNLITHSAGECAYCGSSLNYGTDAKTAAAKTQNSGRKDADFSNTTDVHTLPAGFYTLGIDIPVRRCNVTAISGTGYLRCSDTISEVFGINDSDVSSFKGLKLRKNTCLKASGVLTIKLVYRPIDEDFSEYPGRSSRSQPTTGSWRIRFITAISETP